MVRRLLVLVLVLGLFGLALAPGVASVPEEFFIFQPDPEQTKLEEGDGIRVCAVQPLFGFAGAAEGAINVTKPSGVQLSQTVGDEDCVSFSLNETGQYEFMYPEADGVGGGFMTERNTTLVVGSETVQTNQTNVGFGSFDSKLVELSLLLLAVLAFMNGWVISGAFAWVAAIGTQIQAPGTLTYTLGYTGFALFLGLELVGHKFGAIRKTREFFSR